MYDVDKAIGHIPEKKTISNIRLDCGQGDIFWISDYKKKSYWQNSLGNSESTNNGQLTNQQILFVQISNKRLNLLNFWQYEQDNRYSNQ